MRHSSVDIHRTFEEQYYTLVDRVYRYCYLRVQHNHDCEDLVAEIFMNAYEKLYQYDESKGSVEQWLLGIARYKIIDYWKGRKVTVEFEEALLLVEGLSSADVESSVDQKIFFERFFEHLPKDIHIMITLRYVDDLTYEDIATIINKTPDSVRQFFSRFHKSMRNQYSNQHLLSSI